MGSKALEPSGHFFSASRGAAKIPVVKQGDLNLTPLQLMNPKMEATHKKKHGTILPTVGPYSSQLRDRKTGGAAAVRGVA